MIEPLAQRPLYLDVADRVRELIYRAELKPGDWIDEPVLCAQLGISRTPLREALKVLHAENLVELVPRRGCRVNALDDEALLELFPVMASLEALCARFATQKLRPAELKRLERIHARLEEFAEAQDVDRYYEANREFHRAIQDLAANRWLHRITGELRNVLVLARHRQLTMPGRLNASLAEHRELMRALRIGDADAAYRAMHEHLCRQERALRAAPDDSPRTVARA
ncbi:MAG: GntR family transcriptional regulator [Chromatiales bacterium]|nr:GntR family transcriptional regulator [Chromatiales bacterium]